MMPETQMDLETAFLDALAEHGLAPARSLEVTADGRVHRFTVKGDKSGSNNGWYILFGDGVPAGSFGSWKTGQNIDWCLKGADKLTDEERAEWRRQMQEARNAREAELKQLRKDTAAKAKRLWQTARRAPADHPYLVRKNAKGYGLKQLKEQLLVPVRDDRGEIASLQFIFPNGDKRFLTGGEMAGNYCSIGKPGDTICICEGFVTGASIYEATEFAVAVAFNDTNLLPVAKIIRAKFPAARIIICADNDQWTETPVKNPGVHYAEKAAREIGALLAVPQFQDLTTKPTDFNDLRTLEGLDAVRQAIEGVRQGVVVPIESVRIRREFEERIKAIEETEEGETIAAEARTSDLSEAIKEKLFADIRKKTGLLVKDLRKRDSKRPDEGGEDPALFIPELNDLYAVTPWGGRVYIMSRELDPLMNRMLFKFYSKQDLELLYANRKTFSHGNLKTIAEAWLESAERRQYKGVVFAPGGDLGDDYFNLFQGWGVEPGEGSINCFLDYLYDQIADRDQSKMDYLLSWSAHIFQRPAELPEVAIALRGGQGTGKDTLVKALTTLVNPAHYLVLTNLNQITGQFSGHLADVLLVFCNEVVWGGDKSAEGTLKDLITGAVQPIERKGKDLILMPNYKRLIVASNENWVVPRGLDDRRFAIFDVSDRYKQNAEYFQRVRTELQNGGYRALMRFFLDLDLNGWHPRQIPTSLREAGWDLKIQSASSVIRWWYTCLDYGYINGVANAQEKAEGSGGFTSPWPESLPKPDAHRAYLRWCEANKIPRPEHECMMAKELRRFGVTDRRSRKDGRVPHYVFPPLELAREIFSKEAVIPADVWKDTDEA